MSDAKWLIGRQPILDRGGSLAGYELLFRSSKDGPAGVDDPSLATVQVMLGTLSGFGAQEILGGHRGFINVDRELLFSDALELLPRDLTVIEVLETVEPDAGVVRRCRDLAAAGFALALDDHEFDAAYEELYRIVQIVKIDVLASPLGEVSRMVDALRAYPVKLLAEKVETQSGFRSHLDLGFDYFQGYFFARPAVMERRRIDEAVTTLLKLVRLLGEDADTTEVEGAFRTSPALTFKLLVLVNSVAFGSRERIATVRQAITMLGRRQLRRWLQLALFASSDLQPVDDPLLETAAVRACFMEQLAAVHPALRSSHDAREQAFMAGILSLLDAIYETSMAKLVESLHLSEVLGDALVERSGPLGDLLKAVEQIERLDFDAAWKQLRDIGITQEQALEAQWRAFAWRSGH
jgi:c-di-GMP-related signal transduction protein